MADTPSSRFDPAGAPVPQQLCDIGALTAGHPAAAGALWRLAEPGRQLDANVVRLPPGKHVDTHVEPDLDVLLVVTAGDGTLGTALGAQPLAEGSVVWLPHGSSRSITAGGDGISYLTVHRRRPGMQIQAHRTGG
ncbi:cupin domain-containing protein [Streptomyces morookaense]|uniref:cupin domain-containing protein n=1 Tax=Streptomyces morookaense TaxID=1970 RepID=UPI0033DB4335